MSSQQPSPGPARPSAPATRSKGDARAPDESEYVTLTRRRALKAFDWGAVAAIGVSLGYGILVYPVGLTWGLIAVAVGGGWVIGAAVRRGAWSRSSHERSWPIQLLGAVFGVIAWFGGVLVAYLLSQALLPSSEFGFVERLARTSPGDYLVGLYQAGGLIHSAALAAMAIMGWRTAR